MNITGADPAVMTSCAFGFFVAFDAELAVETSFWPMFESKARTVHHLECGGRVEFTAWESGAEFATLAEMAGLAWGWRLAAIDRCRFCFAVSSWLRRGVGVAFHAIVHARER